MITVSTSKSGSNWLDRLRSSRGFPTGDDPDLDRFLSSSTSSASTTRSESTHRFRRDNSRKAATAADDGNLAGDGVSDVLCDLFNMGECSRSFSKKNCRKQSNPRFFNAANLGKNKNNNELCSSDDLRREKSENAVASSGDNSLNNKNHISNQNQNPSNCNDIGNDNDNKVGDGYGEEEEMIDMKEYTRSEVTVIDTSVEGWKSDKWVFRKKDEWKIKDKKKSKFTGKKKKLLLAEVDDDDEKMKKNHTGNDDNIGDQLTKKKQKILFLNKPPNDKARELLKEAAEFVGKVPQSRFPCPRPPEKLRAEGSPVMLLKSIPPSNTANTFTRLGKSAHKKRPKKMKII